MIFNFYFILLSSYRYVPASLKRFLASFDRLPRATLRKVDEFRTTKLCHQCYEVLASPSPWSGHRWKRCDNCHKRYNRDINAGYNMLTVGLAKDYGDLGYELPQKMSRSVGSCLFINSSVTRASSASRSNRCSGSKPTRH